MVLQDWPATITRPDPPIALRVLRTAFVAAFRLSLGLALSLPAAAIVITLRATAASMSSGMPLIASNMRLVNSSAALSGHHPRRRQIERHDADMAGCQLGLEPIPVSGTQTGQPDR